jgi:hypothetical protein
LKSPIRVAVTGAAGQIGYSLVFRIASGSMFGSDQPVILHLIEIPPALPALGGVVMELQDCAFPLLKGIVATASLDEGFKGVNWALLVGSVPRKAGMERKDLLGINGRIFVGQGQEIARQAASDVRILVVGNPCNTNCLIAMNNARAIPPDRWFAMTMLDQNRAVTQLALKAGVDTTAVSRLAIWGNHSSTMYREDRRPPRGGGDRRPVVVQGHVHPDRAAARSRNHQGPRAQLGGLGGKRGRGHCPGPHDPDRPRSVVQRRHLHRRRLRNRKGPHFFVSISHRRSRPADRPGSAADGIRPLQSDCDRE